MQLNESYGKEKSYVRDILFFDSSGKIVVLGQWDPHTIYICYSLILRTNNPSKTNYSSRIHTRRINLSHFLPKLVPSVFWKAKRHWVVRLLSSCLLP